MKTDRAALAARVEKLAAELEAAFRNRAHLYRLMLEELTGEMGAEAAEALMTRTVTRYGQEVAAAAFGGFGPHDAKALGEAFLAASPNGGHMYPTDVERGADEITFKVRRCPLKDAWTAAGVGDEKLTTLCRIAGAFDRGLFEATGVRFSNVTWSPGHSSGCCRISLANGSK
ncbi:hypothetical protein ASD44_11530 [Mesorhizobium sp. Root554]|uniref:L-2-amino-thiazoline-4-carboxylic acid hydrolase n=1 Tax=unclassified Mesorhizobium TaxID=325217 RepID=UPI0006F2BD19|nr:MULTISPECIES: L-2-amino-thiazoline-4-carboxylic acid hydrolase [unclassified Mesorhizobium]KQZ14630.1 hypothetical protein ASD27_11540 [Mesorhizobium sp. Root1471]KQZ37138.1 hypothetical protein ASD44_11530 [Mesorhizobium sp. Root554]